MRFSVCRLSGPRLFELQTPGGGKVSLPLGRPITVEAPSEAALKKALGTTQARIAAKPSSEPQEAGGGAAAPVAPPEAPEEAVPPAPEAGEAAPAQGSKRTRGPS